MVNKSYVIGVDCGGSHTVAIAYSLKGTVLQTVQTGPANLTVNVELAIQNMMAAVQPLLSQLGTKQCQRILLGISGLGTYPNVADLPAKLGLADQNVKIINDAQLAQIAKLRGQAGLLVLVGTGSIILGMLQGKTVRVGGWGHLLGDEGSGYQLGQLAVRQVTLEQDTQQLSGFSHHLLEQVKVLNTSALVRKFYQWDKGQVAKLAPFVLQQAAAADETASKIVGQAVKGIVAQINTAVSLSNWPLEQVLPVALSGSIVEKSAYYRSVLVAQLQAAGISCEILPIDELQNNASAVLYCQ